MLVQCLVVVTGYARVLTWLENLVSERSANSKVGAECAVDKYMEVSCTYLEASWKKRRRKTCEEKRSRQREQETKVLTLFAS